MNCGLSPRCPPMKILARQVGERLFRELEDENTVGAGAQFPNCASAGVPDIATVCGVHSDHAQRPWLQALSCRRTCPGIWTRTCGRR